MKKPAKSAGTLQSPPEHRSHQKYVLRLYVTGTTTRSMRAIANIKNICEDHLKGRYQLEVIDIYENPSLGKGEQIIASPTLIKKLPLPLRRFIGDLSNTERILLGLDLQPGHYSANKTKNYEELDREIKSLRSRLAETEQALEAIRTGEIDAVVVSGKSGEQVYTLKGADHTYRVLLEALNEAALTLTADGTILYCNSRFSEMTKTSSEQLLGSSIRRLIESAERKVFGKTLRQSAGDPTRREFNIRAADGSLIPALFSVKNLEIEGMTAFCVVITDITDRKRTEAALQKSEKHYRELFQEGERMRDELQRLSREILRVQEEERTRISREIHDEIGQALTAISLNLSKLKTNGKPSEVKRKIQSVQNLVEKASDFIHLLSRQIHPSMLEDLGLFPALRSFVRDFQASTGIRVNLKFSGTPGRASIEQKVALYRIVQESLTNVLKHSGTRNAMVMIRKSPEGITLQVVDNGRGFEVAGISGTREKRQGFGILGMRERARLVGARFMILSRPGKGTRVRVHLPLAGGANRKIERVSEWKK